MLSLVQVLLSLNFVISSKIASFKRIKFYIIKNLKIVAFLYLSLEFRWSSIIKNYLIEQEINPNLVEDSDDFLSEINFQVKSVIENIGIVTKEFLIDDDSVFFFLEGEEKLTFLWD